MTASSICSLSYKLCLSAPRAPGASVDGVPKLKHLMEFVLSAW